MVNVIGKWTWSIFPVNLVRGVREACPLVKISLPVGIVSLLSVQAVGENVLEMLACPSSVCPFISEVRLS